MNSPFFNDVRCEKCMCRLWNCICERVAQFFDDCSTVKTSAYKEFIAPVIDFAEFRKSGQIKEIA